MISLFCTKEVAIQNSATLRKVLIHVACPKETNGIVICSENLNDRHEVHFNNPKKVRSSSIGDHESLPSFEVCSHERMEGSFFFCIEAKKERFSTKLGKVDGAPNRWKIQLLVDNHPTEIGLSFVVVSKKHDSKSFKVYEESIAKVLSSGDYSLLASIPDICSKNQDMEKFNESLSRKRSINSLLGSTPDDENSNPEFSTAAVVGDGQPTMRIPLAPILKNRRSTTSKRRKAGHFKDGRLSDEDGRLSDEYRSLSDESLLLVSDMIILDGTNFDVYDTMFESFPQDKTGVADVLDRCMRV